jgi:hypothetical protein
MVDGRYFYKFTIPLSSKKMLSHRGPREGSTPLNTSYTTPLLIKPHLMHNRSAFTSITGIIILMLRQVYALPFIRNKSSVQTAKMTAARTALDGEHIVDCKDSPSSVFCVHIFLTLCTKPITTEMGADGSFNRKEASWRNWISNEEGAKFPPEKDRYHLYVANACPWAHRTMITRAIKGLQDVISVTIVMPGECIVCTKV